MKKVLGKEFPHGHLLLVLQAVMGEQKHLGLVPKKW